MSGLLLAIAVEDAAAIGAVPEREPGRRFRADRPGYPGGADCDTPLAPARRFRQ